MSYRDYMQAFLKLEKKGQDIRNICQQQCKELTKIPYQFSPEEWREISQILNYPSVVFANKHKFANKLGARDIKKQQKGGQTRRAETEAKQQASKVYTSNENIVCACCGLEIQEKYLSYPDTLLQILKVRNMGISTHEYFLSFLTLGILLTVLFLMFSMTFTGINIFGYFKMRQTFKNFRLSFTIIPSSLPWRILGENTMPIIQGVVVILVMFTFLILFSFQSHFNKIFKIAEDENSTTIGDFSLWIKNVPKLYFRHQSENITNEIIWQELPYIKSIKGKGLKKELQTIFDKFVKQKTTKNEFSGWEAQQGGSKQKVEIASIFLCSPYFIQNDSAEIRKIKNNVKAKKQQFLQNLITSCPERDVKIQELKKQIWIFNKYLEKSFYGTLKQLKQQYDTMERLQVLVCFKKSSTKDFFEAKINQTFTKSIEIELDNQTNIEICEAPEPEDIRWENLYHSFWYRFFKYCFTFGVSIVLLACSLFAILLISRSQRKYQDSIMGFLQSKQTTIVIVMFNIIIEMILRRLTAFEQHRTYTGEQNSLAIKAIILTLLNSIVVPFGKILLLNKPQLQLQKIFIENALSLSISNAIIPPIVQFLSLRAKIGVRIQRWYYSSLSNRLTLSQAEFNKLYEGREFQVGYEYIHIVNTFLITCFYAPSQPLVVAFGILGIYFMYKVQVYLFFREYKRPIPSDDTISKSMRYFILAGPLMFAIGNVINNFSAFSTYSKAGLIINMVACAFGLIVLLAPIHKISMWNIFENKEQSQKFEKNFKKDLDFEKSERQFSQTYDQSHPYTRSQAIKKQLQFEPYQKQSEKSGSLQLRSSMQNYDGSCALNFQSYIKSKRREINYIVLNKQDKVIHGNSR